MLQPVRRESSPIGMVCSAISGSLKLALESVATTDGKVLSCRSHGAPDVRYNRQKWGGSTACERVGAVLFILGGLAAAFGVASCCALPMLLTTIGVSTASLGGLALLAAPHRGVLLIFGALCLAGGAALLWRHCAR
jgi:hypothetical protein